MKRTTFARRVSIKKARADRQQASKEEDEEVFVDKVARPLPAALLASESGEVPPPPLSDEREIIDLSDCQTARHYGLLTDEVIDRLPYAMFGDFSSLDVDKLYKFAKNPGDELVDQYFHRQKVNGQWKLTSDAKLKWLRRPVGKVPMRLLQHVRNSMVYSGVPCVYSPGIGVAIEKRLADRGEKAPLIVVVAIDDGTFVIPSPAQLYNMFVQPLEKYTDLPLLARVVAKLFQPDDDALGDVDQPTRLNRLFHRLVRFSRVDNPSRAADEPADVTLPIMPFSCYKMLVITACNNAYISRQFPQIPIGLRRLCWSNGTNAQAFIATMTSCGSEGPVAE